MKQGDIATFEDGEVIYQKGDLVDYIYILVDGVVDFEATATSGHNLDFVLEEGDYFGEISTILMPGEDALVRFDTATARGAVRCQVIPVDEFRAQMRAMPVMIQSLMQNTYSKALRAIICSQERS